MKSLTMPTYTYIPHQVIVYMSAQAQPSDQVRENFLISLIEVDVHSGTLLKYQYLTINNKQKLLDAESR